VLNTPATAADCNNHAASPARLSWAVSGFPDYPAILWRFIRTKAETSIERPGGIASFIYGGRFV
jgi:hypothetical protein